MTASRMAAPSVRPSRGTVAVQNIFKRKVADWVDKSGEWWQVLGERDDPSRRTIAATFHRFVRAYLAIVSSGCEEPGDMGASCQQIVDGLHSSRRDGEIPMSAVISSFQR